jgi:hypothetical protein
MSHIFVNLSASGFCDPFSFQLSEPLPCCGNDCIYFSGIRYKKAMQPMAKPSKSIKAFAYLRTSSAANIGEDKDSGRRQFQAIEGFARRAGLELVGTYYDEAVKGSDPIDTRPGFAEMLEALEANGTKTIIVETANRFARDLMVQEVGFAMLKARGFDLIAADSPTSFLDDTPTARLIRQVLGAISEFEKAKDRQAVCAHRSQIDVGTCFGACCQQRNARRGPMTAGAFFAFLAVLAVSLEMTVTAAVLGAMAFCVIGHGG